MTNPNESFFKKARIPLMLGGIAVLAALGLDSHGSDAFAGDIHTPDGAIDPYLSTLDTQSDSLLKLESEQHELIWRLRDALAAHGISFESHPLYAETSQLMREHLELGDHPFSSTRADLSLAQIMDSSFFENDLASAQTEMNDYTTNVKAVDAKIHALEAKMTALGYQIPAHHSYTDRTTYGMPWITTSPGTIEIN